MMAGARRRFEVTLNSSLMLVLKYPASSATPTPSIATSTTPRGAKPVKMLTMFDRKYARADPLSRLTTRIGSPDRGSISVNCTGARRADSAHTTKSPMRNSMAGSGSLFPMRSMLPSMRLTRLGGAFVWVDSMAGVWV